VDGIEFYLDERMREPNELELDVGGLRRKHVHAYWEGLTPILGSATEWVAVAFWRKGDMVMAVGLSGGGWSRCSRARRSAGGSRPRLASL
jgi:hypothetical protein